MSDTNASPPPPDPAAQPPYAQQQPPYGQDPYGYAQQPYPAQPRYNTMAIIGFVLSIVVSVVGIVLSFIALSQIKRTGEQGRGLAIAGLVLGYGTMALLAALVIGSVVFLLVVSAVPGGFSSTTF